jgi:hypothetical protein
MIPGAVQGVGKVLARKPEPWRIDVLRVAEAAKGKVMVAKPVGATFSSGKCHGDRP